MSGSTKTARAAHPKIADQGQFRSDERGAALIEYAILLSLIALTCVASLNLVGANTNRLFANLAAQLHVGTGGSGHHDDD
jgi:Flp pilus assembly pilin Flp